MPIKLPDCEALIFESSPLEEVICQLQFNPILRISASAPAEFQDLIRNQFPITSQNQGLQFAVNSSKRIVASSKEPAWQFVSEDHESMVSLASNFIALKTSAYSDFGAFFNKLLPVIEAFEKLYTPIAYTRVGLRYVNRIVIPRHNGQAVPWGKYINNRLSGILADSAIASGLEEFQNLLLLRTNDGRIGCRYSKDTGKAGPLSAERFTLDFDHFTNERVESSQLKPLLVSFNHTTYKLFRWCLTPEGIRLLKPRSKSEQVQELGNSDEAEI